jgi:hypothetical protein
MSKLSTLAMSLGMKTGPVRKGVTPRRVLEYVLSDMVMVQADQQITTDPDSLAELAGMMSAYKNVAHFIAPVSSAAKKAPRVKVKA